jgi:aspartate/methionine/tyrosine aminotransferase
VTPRAEVEKLVKGLAAWPDVAIMSDEIYDCMTYDGEEHVSLLTFPEVRDRLILLNGFSKTWAMTGWRLGWSIWPAPLYDKVRKLAVNCWSCVNAPTQYAGIAAIDGPQDDVKTMVAAFDRRRAVVTQLLNTLPGVSCVAPKGAFYAFPNVSKTGWAAKKLAGALLDDAGVALIGGPDFGVNGEGYIRVSYANSEENIRKAVERIGDFLSRRNATGSDRLAPRADARPMS